jgi:hypothetical protein
MILKLEIMLPNKVVVLTLYNLRNEGKMEAFQTRFPNQVSKPPPEFGVFNCKSKS